MRKNALAVILLALAVALVGSLFIMNMRPRPAGNENQQPPVSGTDMSAYFMEQLVSQAIADIGQPVEGFDPDLLMLAYPGLAPGDFDGARTGEGHYELQGNQLVFVRDRNDMVSSAERTLSAEGYATLLVNLSARLGMSADTEKEIDAIIAVINTSERIETTIDQGGSALGVRIVPLEVLEDSRCAIDVVCVQAGTVRVRAMLELASGTSELSFTLENPVRMETAEVTLERVEPQRRSGADIDEADYIFYFKIEKITPVPPGTACTKEAKLCPDGSYVGRVPPDCRFAPCPPPPPSGPVCKDLCGNGSCEEVVCEAVGCPCAESASTCPVDCGRPPEPHDCSPKGTCRDGEACPFGTSCSGLPAYGCYPDGCPTPICLSAGSRIATPLGDVAVTAVGRGMLVWTSDGNGGRMPSLVVSTGSADVGTGHEVVHLVLADGRQAMISPGHPTAGGGTVGRLSAGQPHDGSVVISAELVPYGHGRTYDLLPAGPSGAYWVDGILMGSTLR